MRYFELLNGMHVAAMLIIPVIFLIVFAVGLGFVPMSGPLKKADDMGKTQPFADGIEKGNGPFPLVMALIIAGTVLWAFVYILYYGFPEVVI